MTSKEARVILNVKENASKEEIEKQFKHLFEANEGRDGSFYLQSKIYRSKQCLDLLEQKESGSGGTGGAQTSQNLDEASQNSEEKTETGSKQWDEKSDARTHNYSLFLALSVGSLPTPFLLSVLSHSQSCVENL